MSKLATPPTVALVVLAGLVAGAARGQPPRPPATAPVGAPVSAEATLDPAAPDVAQAWLDTVSTIPPGGTLIVANAPLPYLTHTVWHSRAVAIRGPGAAGRARLTAVAGVIPLVVADPQAQWDRTNPDLAQRDAAGAYRLTADFGSDHHFDLYGIADQSFATRPGQRFGLATRTPSGGNTRPDHFYSWQDLPPATADGNLWGDVGALTLTVLFAGQPGGRDIIGGGAADAPEPIYLTAGGDGMWHGAFRCGGDREANLAPRSVRFGNCRWGGGRSIVTLQVDCRAGRVRAWQDRREVAVIAETGAGGPGPAFGGQTFALNRATPWLIGATAGSAWASWDVANRGDVRIGSFCMHKAVIYDSDPAGNQVFIGPLARLPVDDFHMLEGVDYDGALGLPFLCHYDTLTPPAGGARGREVFVVTGRELGHVRAQGLAWPTRGDVTNKVLGPIRVTGLALAGTGPGCLLGPALDVRFDDCAFAGMVGLDMVPGAAIYPVTLTNCRAVGYNAGIIANGANLVLRDMAPADVGRVGLSAAGCNVAIDGWWAGNLFQPAGGRNEALVEFLDTSSYGARLSAHRLGADTEGGPGLAYGLVHALAQPSWGIDVLLDDLSGGATRPGVPLVTLDDTYPWTAGRRATYRISGATPTPGAPIVRAQGVWSAGQ